MQNTVSESKLLVCENTSTNAYGTTCGIRVETERVNSRALLLRFDVEARQWQKTGAGMYEATASMPELTKKLPEERLLITYLYEAGKHVSLPFTYFQSRLGMSFRSILEEGAVRIQIPGNFKLSPRLVFTFRVLIIHAKGLNRFRTLNWRNFEETRYLFRP